MDGPVACFMMEPAGLARRSLRRYQTSRNEDGSYRPNDPCASSGTGYHNAHTDLADVPCHKEPSGDSWVWQYDEPPMPARDDPRWPKTCACGYAFLDRDEWQVFHDVMWRAADGRTFGERNLPPGAMRDVGPSYSSFMPKPSPDGKVLWVVLPCGHDWFIDGPSSNNNRMGWTRSGTPPTITVTPSIQCGSNCYHGWLRDGVLVTA